MFQLLGAGAPSQWREARQETCWRVVEDWWPADGRATGFAAAAPGSRGIVLCSCCSVQKELHWPQLALVQQVGREQRRWGRKGERW